MPKKIRELKAILQKAGFDYRTAKGSHTFWTHPLIPDEPVTKALPEPIALPEKPLKIA